MATPEDNLARFQEISNRGLQANLSPDKRARFDEALNRGLIQPIDEAAEIQAGIPQLGNDSFLDKATGAAPTLVSGAVGGMIGEAAGLATLPFNPTQARPVADQISSALTINPRTEAGMQGLRDVATNPGIKKVLEFDEFLRDNFKDAGGAVGGEVGRAVGDFIPSIIETMIGVKAAKSGVKAAGAASEALDGAADAAKVIPEKAGEIISDTKSAVADKLPGRKKAKELIESGQLGDARTAKFNLNDAGKIEVDPFAKESIKQGFDKGVVADIKGASAATRQKMRDMVNIVERGLNNSRFSALNRASDVVGDSLTSRFSVVHQANRRAGKKLDFEAGKLKGKPIDATGPVDNFLDDLESIGVQFDPSTRTINFKGSDIEGLAGPEAAVKNIVNRMLNTRTPDAYDVHRLKKFIDENVTFGKSASGLGGKTESILKSLRHDLDGLLDTNFPDYNKVNLDYAETRGVIDAFQDAAGKKINLTGPNADKAIGTLSRRLLSNAQSRANLLNSINDLDALAKKLSGKGPLPVRVEDVLDLPGGKFKDDIISQVLFVDELDSVFRPAARTSLQGDVQKAVGTAGRAARSPTEAVIDTLGSTLEKTRGINEEGALKAVKDLLKD